MDEGKPPCLSEGYRTASYVSTSLGLFLNALAIVLIVFRTTKELRVYSRVLLGNCVVDVLFIVVTFVVDLVGIDVYFFRLSPRFSTSPSGTALYSTLWMGSLERRRCTSSSY